MFKLTNKYDKYFLIIFFIGIFFRILSLLIVPIRPDAASYIEAAKSIIHLNYETHRPPGFPLTILPFLLLIQNDIIAAKLASFSAGILLIFFSYIIFRKASIVLFKTENSKHKTKFIGLLTSCLISFNSYFASNSGMGLRENLLALQLILVFYYTVIKERAQLKDYLISGILISFLTLTLLTAGIFVAISIFLFYLIAKIKYFKFVIKDYKKLIFLISSFALTFLIWTLFCAAHFGSPFYNWEYQSSWFKRNTIVDLTSLGTLPLILIQASITGFIEIFIDLFLLIGVVFMLLVFYILLKNIRNKSQLFFIFIVVGVNFFYLSVFITTPRLIMYFFPLIFYIGAIPLGEIYMQNQALKENKENSMNLMKKIDYFLLSFYVTYIFRNFNYYFYFPEEFLYFNPFLLIVVITIIFLLYNEISLLIYLRKNREISYSKL